MSALLVYAFAFLDAGLLYSQPEDSLVACYTWTHDDLPQGEFGPELVEFQNAQGLKFTKTRQTRVDLCQGDGDSLRLKDAFTLAAVVEIDKAPTTKISIISKWRLVSGGRSYELGITSSQRLFFTVSASGSWPQQARELLSSRPLRPGVPYFLVARYEPAKRMALSVNGYQSGELTGGVPEAVFDSSTPVFLGNRFGNETACGFDGKISEVWFFNAALPEQRVRRWADRLGLDSEPEPEFPTLDRPYDLDAIQAQVQSWYQRLQAPGKPYGAYRLTASSPPDLYASADIAWIRWIMDDLELTDDQRCEWIDFIQDQQDPEDGSYRHITGHCKTHAFCHATGALNMLGGKQRYSAKLLDPYYNIQKMSDWLDNIDWVRQWGASHDIWGAGVPLASTAATPESWRDALFVWLNGEVDPPTGFWRKGVVARSPLEYLGGAFHIWPVYAAAERPIPYPDRVIDSVLTLQRPDGSFDGGFDYGNMDGVWVLQYLSEELTYRRQDVLAALDRNLDGLMEIYNTRLDRFLSSAHSTESRIATLAILQAALPRAFKSLRPWRNPWHRRELFVLQYEVTQP